MRNFLRAVFGSLTARREKVVASVLKEQHAIDLHETISHVCSGNDCRRKEAEVNAISARMHDQSHRLHVLQWKTDRLAARIKDEPDTIVVPIRAARPS